ncbi:MAG: MFS transporter, partial [Prevotella sp.]
VMAPVLGGTVAGIASWQGVFCLLLAIGVILMVCSMMLKESLPAERRIRKNVVRVYGNLFKVFRNPVFTLCTLAMMACSFGFFAYIASSPFILQQIYRLSPLHFSLCFAVNALMLGIGSGIATQFKHQSTALKCGAIDMVISAVLVALFLLTGMPLIMLMGAYIYLLLSFGLMQPVLIATALDSERDNAGAAGAIFGAAMFFAGGLASPLTGIGDLPVSSSIVIFSGALVCLLIALPLCRRMRESSL